LSGPRIGVLAPLRHRDFRLLAVGSLVSLLGDGVFRVTIAIQVLSIRPDAWALSLVAASWATAQFLTLPAGGWAADRFPRRTVMLLADVVRGVALGILALLSITGTLELWHLCALGAVVGSGNGFFNPTAMSLVPDLLPSAELERANAFLGVARPTMVWIVGPLIGATVISVGGAGTALGLDALTFLVSAGFLLFIRARPSVALDDDGRGFRRTISDVAEGFRYVRRRRWAWGWMAAAAASTMVHSGAFEVLLPTLLVNELGLDEAATARTLAFAFVAGGCGSVLASTVLGQRGLPRRFMSALFVAEGLAMAAVVGYGTVTGTWQVAILGLCTFTLFAVTDIIATTMFQRLVPRRLLGRVSSLDWMASVGLAPVGFIVAGPLDALIGPRLAIFAMGAFGVVMVATMGFMGGSRHVERRGRLRDLAPDDDAEPHAPVAARIPEAAGLDGPGPPAGLARESGSGGH
jgi:DHA3 family tetracycline resistance protein-like MFS transporter